MVCIGIFIVGEGRFYFYKPSNLAILKRKVSNI